MFEFIMGALAVYGVSTLMSDYGGPKSLLLQLRTKYKLFDCSVCIGVWVAIPIAILLHVGIVGYLAFIGTNIILSRLI
jgi:hypothetical protein